MPPFDGLFDLAHDGGEIVEDAVVGDAQDLETLRGEPRIAFRISNFAFFRLMGLSVQFNDEPCRRTEEIHDVGCDRNLSLERVSIAATASDLRPEQASALVTKRRCSRANVRRRGETSFNLGG